jgi:hypothetical protein
MLRRRCSECRKTFVPARSAAGKQCVCSSICRIARARKLARKRRGRELEQSRADERERQRAHRARHDAVSCHAPASPRKYVISREEVVQIVDRALALSRTTLERDLPRFLDRIAQKAGERVADVTPQPSRESA